MLLTSLAIVAVAAAGLAVALTAREFLAVREELAEADRAERRYRTWARECKRFLSTRATLVDAPGRLIRKVAAPKPIEPE